MTGPQPMNSKERHTKALEISVRFQQVYAEQVIAVGVYGSLARQTDGPYSDIEMFVVVQGEKIDKTYEWASKTWKAEVNVCSPDVLEGQAAMVESDWPITHGAFLHIWPIHDPTGFFPKLGQIVMTQPDEAFRVQMECLIVGEIFEMVGKVRNAVYNANADPLAAYMIELALYGARLVGLANRHSYRSFSQIFADSLNLAGLPDGYRELCGAAMCGDLRSPQLLLEICDSFWQGVETWAEARSLQIYSDLDDLIISSVS